MLYNGPATERQKDYVRLLLDTRVVPDATRAMATAMLDKGMTAEEANGAINAMKNARKIPGRTGSMPKHPTPESTLTEGMYEMEGSVFRVTKRSDGDLFVEVLVFDNVAEPEPYFDTARNVLLNLRPEHRMTLAEVMSVGHDTGYCIVCGAALSDPKTTAMGIGPVCIKRFWTTTTIREAVAVNATRSRAMDLRGFDKPSRELIKRFTDAGWTGRLSGNNHWIGHSPDGTATTSVSRRLDASPSTRRNAEADLERWLRLSTPPAESIEAAARAIEAGDAISAEVIANGAVKRMVAAADEVDEAIPVDGSLAAEGSHLLTGDENLLGISERVVVRTAPTEGKAIERLWSDGVVDFACPSCDKAYERVRSANAHYGQAHLRHEAEPVESVTFTDSPLVEGVQDGTTIILDEVVFTPIERTAPDVLLARVQAIVSAPLLAEIEALKARVTTANANELAAVQQRDEIAGRLVSIERDLAAFRELAQQIGLS